MTRLPEPRRIAVLRALYLGDLLVSVPALRALRERYPAAEITLIGLPWAASFTERFNHLLDRFLPFPGAPGIGEVPYDGEHTQAFIDEQRAYGYDIVIQLHGSGQTSNPFALALGGAITVGYFVGSAPDGLSIAAAYPDALHEIDRNLHLVGLLGCATDKRALEFPLTPADRAEAQTKLGVTSSGPFVVIHPGAKFLSRRWMPERFAAVADDLIERVGARVALTGIAGERDVIDEVAAHMRHDAIQLAGQTSLGGLAAIIEQSSLLITNDTGPAHLAAALRTPTVVLYGPGDVNRWGPLDTHLQRVVRVGVTCSPCPHDICPIDHRCLRWIDAERVMREARELLTQPRTWQEHANEYEMELPCAG